MASRIHKKTKAIEVVPRKIIRGAVFTFVCSFLIGVKLFAAPKQFFFSPGISIGYTFHAQWNFGYSFDFGNTVKLDNGMPLRYGLSFTQYYVRVKDYTHRLRSLSVMGQTDFADLKIGFGRARNKWGMGGHNACITHGISYDISFAAPSIYSPWIGFRHFSYFASTWAWFMYPYNSLYVGYRYDMIQNTSLKNTLNK